MNKALEFVLDRRRNGNGKGVSREFCEERHGRIEQERREWRSGLNEQILRLERKMDEMLERCLKYHNTGGRDGPMGK
jgi:hypothetical protein